jgi:hypothetical protein
MRLKNQLKQESFSRSQRIKHDLTQLFGKLSACTDQQQPLFPKKMPKPSPEDILSIMKKRDNPAEQKLVELIFTRWGIWEISSTGKQKFADVPAEFSYLTERVNDIYKWCNGGKTDQYDSKALTAILAQTMKHYNRLGLSITLTPWSIIKDNYYIIFPIT